MKGDDDWGEWSGDFRHAPEPGVAAREIARTVRRRQWVHVAKAVGDVAAYLFGMGVFLVLSMTKPVVWPLASAVLPAFVVALAYSVHVRKGTWSASGETVAAFVELEWRRRRVDVALLRFAQGLLAFLVLGFCVWLPFLLASRGEPRSGGVWRIGLALAFTAATFAGTWAYLAFKLRSARGKLAQAAELRESVADGEAGVAL